MFRDQGQLLKSLQDTVLQYLKWPAALEVAIHPIGLDEAIQHFEDFMAREQQNENEKVKVVGIVGLGGSGKTTLAKEFYNRKSKRYSFNGSSFLFDVRDASTKNELQRLESKLLGDLSLLKGCRIDNISEGKGIIRARLQSSTPNVLIILGDIDPEDQTEDLVVRDVLGSGSSIIVTSREESALKHSGASLIYKIKGLNPEQSQELFYMYAFQQPTPRIGFEESVKKFCKMCGGLPLFLKVMGAHLRFEANNRDDWEDELEHIPEDIRSILNINYDTLHKEEMQIFLDIACFFLGEDKNLAIRVWDTSEGRGSCRRLKNLENKCLVEFDDKNRFKMHDRVRDFGRRIAQDESPCRLWYDDQAASRPKQHKGTMEARGIVAATSYWSLSFDRKIGSSYRRSFYQPPLDKIEMSKLKLLVVKGDCFDEQFHKRSENLLWLRWFDCQHANISPWLMSMRNLTVLELVGANLKEWQLFGEQVHLRGLRIRGTKLSQISIPQNVCPRLEHIDLRDKRLLIEVKHLPTKLVKLSFEDCVRLKRVSASLHLTNPQEFNINGCCQLQELPNLQHLSSLERFNAYNCSSLIQGLEYLAKLRYLQISWCFELHELPSLQHLTSLERFNAYNCANMRNIQGPENLAKLRYLQISGCSELRELPNLQHLSSLETLYVSHSRKLQNIKTPGHLAKLRYLSQFSETVDEGRFERTGWKHMARRQPLDE